MVVTTPLGEDILGIFAGYTVREIDSFQPAYIIDERITILRGQATRMLYVIPRVLTAPVIRISVDDLIRMGMQRFFQEDILEFMGVAFNHLDTIKVKP